MNVDKINELKLLASTTICKKDPDFGIYQNFPVFDLEKFAELIIKECLQQCVYAIESCDEEIHPYYIGAQRAKDNIEYEFEIKL